MLQITAAGFCFGFLGVLGKWGYALGFTPGTLLSLRFLCASALLAPFALRQGLGAPRFVVRALALGVGGYAVFASCYFGALQGLSASLTVLLLYSYPVWVALGDLFFFREPLPRRLRAALAILLLGLALLVWGELRVRDPFAVLLGFLASIFYAAYILASRAWLRGAPPLGSAFCVMLGAGTALGVWHLRAFPADLASWEVVLALAVVGTILPITLFLAGLQKVRAAEASLLSLVEPLTGVLLGALVLGERWGLFQSVGGSLIVAGLALTAWPSARRTP